MGAAPRRRLPASQGPPARLGPLQARVMDELWTHGPATVAEIHARLGSKHGAAGYTTVLVALQKLEKKGLVEHQARGRAYVYHPCMTRDEARSRRLGELLRGAFAGDVRGLVSQLLDLHPATDDELRELRRLIDQRRKELDNG